MQPSSGLRRTKSNLEQAVHKNHAMSTSGVWERLFTFSFRGLVYPQIWEDPLIDLEAMAVRPGDHIVAIASGGCNVLSYLIADPGQITALDLNNAHIGLNNLKLCAARHLPDYDSFRRFFGQANSRENVRAYDTWLRPHLDNASRRYWEGRNPTGQRRISLFSRNFYEYGLLGHFIGAVHFLSKLYGRDPADMLKARNRTEQRAIYNRVIAPIFDKRFVQWLLRQPASLFGLGIPPAQYYALADAGSGGIESVLRDRIQRLACDFDIKDNYFAWQAFGRSYEQKPDSAMPPYLALANFAMVRERVGRVEVRHQSFTEYLGQQAAGSLDCYVLLDAQDWMTDSELEQLWQEITRTARPGARVIFRTAAGPSLLPGRVSTPLLEHWNYDEARCQNMTARDRSAIYGGFHLYSLKAAA